MAVTDPQRLLTDDPQEPLGGHGDRLYASSRLSALALWIAFGLYLLLALRIFVYTPDDTFITFRYARNLAEGYGPVFNRGAPLSDRTEGYSCPLFMILMALVWKLPLGMDLLLRAKFLGLALGLGTLVVTRRLARRLGMPVWAQALLPLLLAVHSSFVVSSISGMETGMMTLLVTLGAYLFVGEWQLQERGKKAGLASAWAFAGCALTRPEGVLFGLAAAGLLLAGRWRRWSSREVRWLLAWILPIGMFLLWRHSYYSLWLPNTYYAKQVPLEDALTDGAKYLLQTFFYSVVSQPLLVALAAGWWILVIAGVISLRFQRPPGLIVPLLAGMQMLFVLKVGGDGMGGWRFMATAVPLLLLLSLAGIEESAGGLTRAVKAPDRTFPLSFRRGVGGKTHLQRVTIGVLSSVLLGLCLLGNRDYWRRDLYGYRSWASTSFTLQERPMLRGWLLDMALTASDWLNTHAAPGAEVADSEMGVTPYLCPQLRFLDTQGLTDHGIATLPGALHNGSGVMDQYTSTKDVVGRYLLEVRKPDYILRGVGIRPEESVPSEPILEDTYVLRATLPILSSLPGMHSFLLIWQRDTSAHAAQ
jgi:hypothetical protein